MRVIYSKSDTEIYRQKNQTYFNHKFLQTKLLFANKQKPKEIKKQNQQNKKEPPNKYFMVTSKTEQSERNDDIDNKNNSNKTNENDIDTPISSKRTSTESRNLTFFQRYRKKSAARDREPSQEYLLLTHLRKHLNEQNQYPSKKIIINVSGLRFETMNETLERFPTTLLGNRSKRKKFYDPETNEYFFDRNRSSFEAILYYYQSGGWLRRPVDVPVDIFTEEVLFYQLDDNAVKKYLTDEGYAKPAITEFPANQIKRQLWLLFEYPESSIFARILATISVLVIILSIFTFCAETIPTLKYGMDSEYFEKNISDNSSEPFIDEDDDIPKFKDKFFIIESMCILFFTVELAIRFICCPNIHVFVKSLMNIIDFLSILPYIITIVTMITVTSSKLKLSLNVLRILRLIRVFRVFKLSRHSRGLQILGYTIKASLRELILLVFFLMISVIIFSSAAYYAEYDIGNSHFRSIPDAFWWAVITMTTVGYGDMLPISLWGKVIGSLCAVAGVLTIALPVPVIVSNFNYFYHKFTDQREMEFFMQLQAAEDPLVVDEAIKMQNKMKHGDSDYVFFPRKRSLGNLNA